MPALRRFAASLSSSVGAPANRSAMHCRKFLTQHPSPVLVQGLTGQIESVLVDDWGVKQRIYLQDGVQLTTCSCGVQGSFTAAP